jgi:hypothetical protein
MSEDIVTILGVLYVVGAPFAAFYSVGAAVMFLIVGILALAVVAIQE